LEENINKDEIIEENFDENPEIIIEKDQAAIYLSQLQRISAEFENFRNRSIKEKAGEYSRAVRDVVFSILPIIDNFGRSLKQANPDDSFVKGIMMIESQLNSALDNLGISKIDALGMEFNPKFHSAISHIEDEGKGKNEIIEELQAGYIYKDSVIRHSLVVVAN
jgi:molecular chaperone GrpE